MTGPGLATNFVKRLAEQFADQLGPTPPRHPDLAAARRRHAAALRLPPLECGCRDPLTPHHLEGHCQNTRGTPFADTGNHRERAP